MIEVKVETVQASWVFPHRVLILKELDNDRYLPIWIGTSEAEAIALHLLGHKTPRPLTHDLLVNTLGILNARLLYIYINSLANNIFYARIIVEVEDQELEIDSRTSDAVAIAVRGEVPIYVHEDVIEEAGVLPEISIVEEELHRNHDAEEEYDLGAFNDFLSSLNMDDLDLTS